MPLNAIDVANFYVTTTAFNRTSIERLRMRLPQRKNRNGNRIFVSVSEFGAPTLADALFCVCGHTFGVNEPANGAEPQTAKAKGAVAQKREAPPVR